MTRTAIACLGLALLAGCEGMAQRPAPEGEAGVAQGYGRAFGRIEYTDAGKPVEWGASSFGGHEALTLYARAVDSGAVHWLDVERDGSYLWPLRPGHYELVGYRAMRAKDGGTHGTVRLMARFSVPQPGQAAYVGHLRVDAGSAQTILLDLLDESAERFRAQLSKGKFEVVRGIMALEEERPRNARRLRAVCAPAWGLQCDGTHQGVVPLQPEGTVDGFPLIPDRRPLLQWKPSSRGDVTYDIVVFESLVVGMGPGMKPLRMRAARVAYAEGLTVPQYRPAEPLPAGKQYEWTVRLRDGDLVSSWSTTSYAAFLLVAAAWGSGQTFGFETPAR